MVSVFEVLNLFLYLLKFDLFCSVGFFKYVLYNLFFFLQDLKSPDVIHGCLGPIDRREASELIIGKAVSYTDLYKLANCVYAASGPLVDAVISIGDQSTVCREVTKCLIFCSLKLRLLIVLLIIILVCSTSTNKIIGKWSIIYSTKIQESIF